MNVDTAAVIVPFVEEGILQGVFTPSDVPHITHHTAQQFAEASFDDRQDENTSRRNSSAQDQGNNAEVQSGQEDDPWQEASIDPFDQGDGNAVVDHPRLSKPVLEPSW